MDTCGTMGSAEGQASAPSQNFFRKLVSHWCIFVHSDVFLARQHYMLSAPYAIARPSVHHTGGSLITSSSYDYAIFTIG